MKNYFAALALICFVTMGFSQSSSDVRYGIRAGLNISNLDFEPGPVSENEHRNGFAFGGFAEFPLTEQLFLNTEIQWSAEGAKSQELRADYIHLPIQLKFALGEKFMIGVGPQASLKTWKNTDGFETFSFSAIGGVEYMISNDLFLDVRAAYGLTNILDDSITTLEAKNFNIQIGIGMKI